MDILKHAKNKGEQDGYTVYEVEPKTIYKAMQKYAQDLIKNDAPMGDIPSRQRRYYSALRDNQGGLDLVSVARNEVTKKADIDNRADALETLRHWFTYLIKEANGGPVGIRITKDEAFRL